MTKFERLLRINIRNAYLVESIQTILGETRNRLSQGKTFEADCLIELAMDVTADKV